MTAVNWTNMTDLGELPAQANVASSGTFWPGMFYMSWVIMMMLFLGFGFETAAVASSFVMLVIGLMMVYAGILPWPHLVSVVAFLLFEFLYIIWSSNQNN